jgi:isopenicillin N synthase-like dioxygenase
MDAPAASVPVIDLSGFVDGDRRRRRELGEQIDRACREVGFFTVVGHGVDEATVEALRTSARAFFDAPLEDRLAVAMPEPGYPYGYNPLQAEALNRSIGGEAQADLKETFNVGPIDPPPRPLAEMADPDERAVYAPNLWPAAVPSLRPAVEAYYRSMADLAATLMEAFAVALGLDDRIFDDLIDAHGSALRLAHYPALDVAPPPGQFRAGAHTDYGTLTILWTDGEPGLQVQAPDGSWLDVEPVDGGLIVNLGDLMARWTNDRWRSTMHRVLAADPSADRLSIPFFHNANWDATVECIVADGEAPKYPPITAGRHLMEKFRSTVM